MSLFAALSIASQSLLSNRTAIDTTNRNITNVYTEGYSREEPVFSDLPGSGVAVETIRRIFDKAYFKRFISENQNNKALSNYEDILQQIESVFNDEQGSGLSETLTQFFNAMHDIAIQPDDIAARSEFLSVAKSLVGRIRDSYSTLEEIKSTATAKIRDQINILNDYLKKVADINKNIKMFQNSPDKLNQYLDERDRALREISSMMDLKITFNENGTVNLYTAKGFALVLDQTAKNVKFSVEDTNPVVKISSINITPEIQNGSIGGLLKGVRAINEAMDKLNTFTTTFANAINDQHKQGYTLYANDPTAPSDIKTNVALFKSDNGSSTIDASNIILAFDDPKMVAAASDSNYLNSDNRNIKALIELKDKKDWATLGNKSFSEYYLTDIVTNIGSSLEHVKNLRENSDFLLQSIEDKIKEISAVNMDEEMINLTRYQRAYQAAAQIVTITDELMQTILNMVG